MLIAIASKRAPKVEAVKAILPQIQSLLGEHSGTIEFLPYEVDAGIEMPRTIDELLTGAKKRVALLQEVINTEQLRADYFIGLEGGFHSVQNNGERLVFLQSWAYVSNGEKGYFGSSGNVPVPGALAKEVMEHSRDLGIVIDEFTQQTNVRSKQGTWGVLTKDLITRQQSFEIALLAAFAPFYNPTVYKQ